MLKRIAVWIAVAVAAVVAVQVLLREGPPPSLVEPPRLSLPALDSVRERPAASADAPGAGDVGAVAAAEQPYAETTPRKFQRRLMFECSGVRIFVRIGDGEAALLPDSSLTGHWIPLALAGSEWRGRYANEDLVFRPDGDVATFVLGEQTLMNCAVTRDRAAFAEVNGGVLYQGFGSEPPWTFEITPTELLLAVDRGARRVEVPLHAPTDDGARMTFRSVVGTQEMVATVDRIPCYDAASGETFALTVAVTFDREWYYGCGRRISYQ